MHTTCVPSLWQSLEFLADIGKSISCPEWIYSVHICTTYTYYVLYMCIGSRPTSGFFHCNFFMCSHKFFTSHERHQIFEKIWLISIKGPTSKSLRYCEQCTLHIKYVTMFIPCSHLLFTSTQVEFYRSLGPLGTINTLLLRVKFLTTWLCQIEVLFFKCCLLFGKIRTPSNSLSSPILFCPDCNFYFKIVMLSKEIGACFATSTEPYIFAAT